MLPTTLLSACSLSSEVWPCGGFPYDPLTEEGINQTYVMGGSVQYKGTNWNWTEMHCSPLRTGIERYCGGKSSQRPKLWAVYLAIYFVQRETWSEVIYRHVGSRKWLGWKKKEDWGQGVLWNKHMEKLLGLVWSVMDFLLIINTHETSSTIEETPNSQGDWLSQLMSTTLKLAHWAHELVMLGGGARDCALAKLHGFPFTMADLASSGSDDNREKCWILNMTSSQEETNQHLGSKLIIKDPFYPERGWQS